MGIHRFKKDVSTSGVVTAIINLFIEKKVKAKYIELGGVWFIEFQPAGVTDSIYAISSGNMGDDKERVVIRLRSIDPNVDVEKYYGRATGIDDIYKMMVQVISIINGNLTVDRLINDEIWW